MTADEGLGHKGDPNNLSNNQPQPGLRYHSAQSCDIVGSLAMRRYLVTVAIVLVLHAVATVVLRAYLGFLVDLGGLFVHNTDSASIWDRELAGFSLMAGALLFAAIVVTYLRGIWAGTSVSPTESGSGGSSE